MARGGLLICVNLHMSYVVFRKKRWVPMAAPEDNFTSCPNALAFAGVCCGWDSPGDGEAWGGGAEDTAGTATASSWERVCGKHPRNGERGAARPCALPSVAVQLPTAPVRSTHARLPAR